MSLLSYPNQSKNQIQLAQEQLYRHILKIAGFSQSSFIDNAKHKTLLYVNFYIWVD